MRHICTYFDKNFLPRGLALLDSLKENTKEFTYYVLALDSETVEYFEKLNDTHVAVIRLDEYIEFFNIDRSQYKTEKEFYFSVTPGLCRYVLAHYKEIDILLYLDADVYVFNDLEILYSEMGNASIALCSHRLPWYIKMMSKNYGIYNVGVNAFRNDEEGNRCLEEWFKDCTTWKEGQEDYPLSFFSDQIWLDTWLQKYKNLRIIEHIGVNTATWNAINYKFRKKDDRYYVNDKPLIIYHFSSLKKLSPNRWHGNTSFTIINIRGILLEIYQTYLLNVDTYEQDDSKHSISLEFEGSKLKFFIYKMLKYIHNHEINTKGTGDGSHT